MTDFGVACGAVMTEQIEEAKSKTALCDAIRAHHEQAEAAAAGADEDGPGLVETVEDDLLAYFLLFFLVAEDGGGSDGGGGSEQELDAHMHGVTPAQCHHSRPSKPDGFRQTNAAPAASDRSCCRQDISFPDACRGSNRCRCRNGWPHSEPLLRCIPSPLPGRRGREDWGGRMRWEAGTLEKSAEASRIEIKPRI